MNADEKKLQFAIRHRSTLISEFARAYKFEEIQRVAKLVQDSLPDSLIGLDYGLIACALQVEVDRCLMECLEHIDFDDKRYTN